MSSPTVQFITRMKLRELRKQLAELNAAYVRLAEEVAAKASPGERLRALYDGLRGITFAAQPLHPEVVNLDILLDEAAAGATPADVLALWESRLERELAAGRARCEFVYLWRFGRATSGGSTSTSTCRPPRSRPSGRRAFKSSWT